MNKSGIITDNTVSHPTEAGRRLPPSVRRSLFLILLLLILTQYPVLHWVNDGQPLLWDFPFLYCYLMGVFVLFFFLLPAIGRDQDRSRKRK